MRNATGTVLLGLWLLAVACRGPSGGPLSIEPQASAVIAPGPTGSGAPPPAAVGRKMPAPAALAASAPPAASTALPAAELTASTVPASSPFASAEQCQVALRARSPRPRRGARLGSWNVRWFPDGVPGKHPKPGTATDLEWLACALAWLELDVVAVQEFKTHAGAQAALSTLTAALDRHTGGRWRADLDDCPNVAGQHVGFLYDAARVTASGFVTHGAINPHGVACQDQLRPGFGGTFRFPGGLDLHLVSVHLKSGGERRSLGLRQRSLDALGPILAEARALAQDDDVIFLGDFNTMGCSRCSPKLTAAEELADFGARLELLGLRPVAPSVACTEYYRGRGGLLDHVVVPRTFAELPATARVEVSGLCGELACAGFRGEPAAYASLGDHCPLVLELDDVDRD